MRLGSAFVALLGCAIALAPDAGEIAWHSLALGRVILDAPADWVARRGRDGSWIIDEPGAGRWTLRIDSDQIDAPAGGAAMRVEAIAAQLEARLLVQFGGRVEVADIDVAEKLLMHSYAAADDEAGLDVRAWHRIAPSDTAIVIARFTHVVHAGLADRPDIVTSRDFVERLVMNAELNPLARPYRPSGAAPVPR